MKVGINKSLKLNLKMNKVIQKQILILILISFLSCEKTDDTIINNDYTIELLFVANEGNFGSEDGSISIINQNGEISTVENIGDTVQSLLVFNDQLFVIVNNSHKIKVYNISEDGLMLDYEISTNNSSPREMVIIDNKLYFTNWNTKDVKVLNLLSYSIESSITLEGLPESIISDGENLFVGIMMNEDYTDASTVVKINPNTNQVIATYDVGDGPTSLILEDSKIFVARTFYDSNWNAFHGTSSIDLNSNNTVNIVNYGLGTACGGSIHSFKGSPFRSFEGGVASIKQDLTIDESTLIGNYDAQNVYSVETIGDRVYVGTYDGYVKVLTENNIEIADYKVGDFPGDFEMWRQ
jgi:hypothetical protein